MSEGTASTIPPATKTDNTNMSTEPSSRELKGLSVEKLTSADDYQLWSYRLESAFEAMELWGYVDGSQPEPDEKNSPEWAMWRKWDRRASYYIANSISDKVLSNADRTTAESLWRSVASMYGSMKKERVYHVYINVSNSKLLNSEPVGDHIAKLNTLFHQLKTMKEPVTEIYKISMFLGSLPDKYDVKRQVLYEKDNLTYVDVCETILQHEAATSASEDLEIRAMAALSKKPWKKGGGNRKCTHCGKDNHTVDTCFEIYGYPGKKRREEVSVAQSSTEKRPDDAFMVVVNSAEAGQDYDEDEFVADSGCTRHLTPYLHILHDVHPIDPVEINLAGKNKNMFAKSAGTVYLDSIVEGSPSLSLTNVLYVPEAAQNLFSLTVVDEKGGYFNTDPSSHQLFIYTKSGKCVATARKPKGRQVWVIGEVRARRNIQEKVNAAVIGGTGSAALWHRRLGHPGQDRFRAAASIYPNLAHLHEFDLRGACHSCGEAKSHRKPFLKFPGKVAEEVLGVVHTDLWVAPVNAPTWDGYKYGLSFVDAHSRMSVVYLLRSKSPYEVFEKFVNYKARMELATGKKIKILRSDQGKEYFGPFLNRLEMWGIKHEFTMAHTSKQNGVAERQNRTLVETVRAFLYDGNDKPDRSLWGEAFMTANYIKNRMPSRVIGMQTPHEVFFGHKAGIDHLRVWGADCVVHLPDATRDKLEKRGIHGIFVGYGTEHKGYRIAVPNGKGSIKIINSRDVDFLEESPKDLFDPLPQTPSREFEGELDTDEPKRQKDPFKPPIEVPSIEPAPPIIPPAIFPQVTTPIVPPITPPTFPVPALPPIIPPPASRRESARVRNQPEGSKEDFIARKNLETVPQRPTRETASIAMVMAMAATTAEDSGIDDEPKSYKSSQERPEFEAKKWQEAVDAEMKAHRRNGTWKKVDKLPDHVEERDVISCKWVFKVKRNARGKIIKYKARLVARGFQQVEGINYEEAWAPVAKFTSLRVLLANAGVSDEEIDQMDFDTAFLNSILPPGLFIFIRLPENGQGTGEAGDAIYLVLKGLYGLKQAARLWYDTLTTTFAKYSLQKAHGDHGIFIYINGETKITVVVYVDDLVLFSNSRVELDALKHRLMADFEMTDMGPVHWFLSMEIIRDRANRTISLNQTRYLTKVLAELGMQECKGVSTPMDGKLESYDGVAEYEEKVYYQHVVGQMMYAMIGTRADICFAVGVLSRFSSNPSPEHLAAVKRVMRYIKSTINYGIVYGTKVDITDKLLGYGDSDWAGDPGTARSTSGYLFTVFGGGVSWRSVLQKTVAQSSTEGEYLAMGQTTREALWIQELMQSLCLLGANEPVIVFSDSKGALDLSKTTKHHDRTKHINVRHHFLRQHVEEGRVRFIHTPTEFMLADAMTKPLGKEKFAACRDGMGIVEL